MGVDLVEPPEIPTGCKFVRYDVLKLKHSFLDGFDFVCASPPCEEFSVWGMRHFHKNPPYPAMGVKLFQHCEDILLGEWPLYVIENVRPAQQFVGQAVEHCGSFYLWGTGVPALLPQGIKKGFRHKEMFAHDRTNRSHRSATIPPELANCVAEYAERILEQKNAQA